LQDRRSEDRVELDRIRSVYEGYARDDGKRRAWADGPAHRFQLERKWAQIGEGLRRASIFPHECRILNLGVGSGGECPSLLEAGFRPDSLIAIDLNEKSVRAARIKHQWLCALAGDGTKVPFRDQSFDVVYQSMMISSVLDISRRATILAEVARVLRPGGAFISYDMRYPNPWNRHTRPLKVAELRRALGGWKMSASSLTGIPQLIRALSRISLPLCRLVEAVPLFRSHLLVFARKP
jgi:ubiquinone/menaquinone biosynthesis C-methylase UbiE